MPATSHPANSSPLFMATTIVINAITERKGAKVGLLTTQGFRDILEIGRGNCPDFNLEYPKPAVCAPFSAPGDTGAHLL